MLALGYAGEASAINAPIDFAIGTAGRAFILFEVFKSSLSGRCVYWSVIYDWEVDIFGLILVLRSC